MTLLDRPIWEALSGLQSDFSVGTARARAYRAEIGPLAALGDDTPEALADLGQLVMDRGALILGNDQSVAVPVGCRADWTAELLQMVATDIEALPSTYEILALSDEDAPEMLALAHLTSPGPFAAQTHRLGQFNGIRIDGRLVAMAGQRMHLPGYREISGVCTHPDARGLGLAKLLCAAGAAQSLANGERPFLHVLADNEPAIRVYRSLGFAVRRSFTVSILVPEANTAMSPNGFTPPR
ncbi:GNAT family N-acetyltransferase [Rhizobium sp. YIM 134829]|uniref:GNAT family N-acetyltransferase n=1 Tax=Rhizobium sp. YIM 134829 TaxID=3390453 RepID=UPI0039796A08